MDKIRHKSTQLLPVDIPSVCLLSWNQYLQMTVVMGRHHTQLFRYVKIFFRCCSSICNL